MNRRVIILGLDGVPYPLLNDLAASGVMPCVGELIRSGFFCRIGSTIPEVSSVAWSSIITGKNPGEHGLFGFTDLAAGTYRLIFPNFTHLKSPPFWSTDEGRSVIVNVPSTFPVREMNGVHISGFVSLDLERSVYPLSLLPMLRKAGYRVDVDTARAQASTGLFLKELDDVLRARREVALRLWDEEEWQTFMLVFTGTDRLMHFLWNAGEERGHVHHADFLRHFSRVDEVIADIVRRLRHEDVLALISDHGFERMEHTVQINVFLAEHRMLVPPEGARGLADLDERTRAFSLDPARIYVNRKGRFPRGAVDPDDVERVVNELAEMFRSLQVEGRAVCRAVFRKEEIYRGGCTDLAPDLLLVGARGFNLQSGLKARSLLGRTVFTGKHTQHDAFLLVRGFDGSGVEREGLTVKDLLPIVNRLRGEDGPS